MGIGAGSDPTRCNIHREPRRRITPGSRITIVLADDECIHFTSQETNLATMSASRPFKYELFDEIVGRTVRAGTYRIRSPFGSIYIKFPLPQLSSERLNVIFFLFFFF